MTERNSLMSHPWLPADCKIYHHHLNTMVDTPQCPQKRLLMEELLLRFFILLFWTSHEGKLSLPVVRGDHLQFHVYCAQKWAGWKILRALQQSSLILPASRSTTPRKLGVSGPAGLSPMVVGAPRSFLAPRASATVWCCPRAAER